MKFSNSLSLSLSACLRLCLFISICLSACLSLTHTHTHTHTVAAHNNLFALSILKASGGNSDLYSSARPALFDEPCDVLGWLPQHGLPQHRNSSHFKCWWRFIVYSVKSLFYTWQRCANWLNRVLPFGNQTAPMALCFPSDRQTSCISPSRMLTAFLHTLEETSPQEWWFLIGLTRLGGPAHILLQEKG